MLSPILTKMLHLLLVENRPFREAAKALDMKSSLSR
jgi:hypothetical protein